MTQVVLPSELVGIVEEMADAVPRPRAWVAFAADPAVEPLVMSFANVFRDCADRIEATLTT